MIFFSHERRPHDPFLALKAVLLVLGASLGIAGMVNDIAWLVYLAIAVIAVGIVLRLVQQRRNEKPEPDDEDSPP